MSIIYQYLTTSPPDAESVQRDFLSLEFKKVTRHFRRLDDGISAQVISNLEPVGKVQRLE